jgi:hypothetical protein
MPRRAASADPLGQVLMPTRNARSMVALRERSWRRCQQIAAATPLASAAPTWLRELDQSDLVVSTRQP